MRSNAGMANRQGNIELRFAQVSAPQLEIWPGLAWVQIHSFLDSNIQRSPHQKTHIKKEKTTPDCPATMPRGPGTKPLSRTRLPAALSPAVTPAPAATTHRVSPTAASTIGEGPVTSTDPDY